MAESAIQWCEQTWNPVVGCSIVSTECKRCYAMKMAQRLELMGQKKYEGLTKIVSTQLDGKTTKNVVWNGVVRLDREALNVPMNRKKPTMYFVNSMSDWAHESLSHSDMSEVYCAAIVADWHTYQFLTKRADRQRDYVNAYIHHMRAATLEPPKHIWLGTSVGIRQSRARIDQLRETIAAVRFLSCEPLLEDLGVLDLAGIHWVIVGGESGPGARPCDLAWIRSIVRQCREHGVSVFVKQIGSAPIDSEYKSGTFAPEDRRSIAIASQLGQSHISFNLLLPKHHKGGDMNEWPEDLRIREYPI